jgi:hypothetical protein
MVMPSFLHRRPVFSSSVPVWYYLLAAYCVFCALTPMPRFRRTSRKAREYGRRFGGIVRRAVFVLVAAGLLRGWSWPIGIAIVFLLLSLPDIARQFAFGIADARAARPGVATAAGPPRPVLLPSYYVAGAAFALLVRGVPVAFMVVALIRIAGGAA